MASVVIRDLLKTFGSTQIIKGVSIDIADGEFVVLVGPSGCGKSTLLRMVAGLESISGGQILIDDTVVNDLASKDRDIAMVFQSYALYPHMNVADNMSFSLRLKKTPPEEIRRKVERAAAALDLGKLLDRYPRELSGGQRQRVAMGRAIVRDPRVFLFDEPLSNLDAKLRVQMRGEIQELHQRLRTTTIYVTHDQIEAMMMADKIVIMRDGMVEQIGAPLDLYDHPANQFVAGFIGSPAMNFIPGKVAGGGFMGDDGRTKLDHAPCAGLAEGQPVILGIRPEHISIEPDGLPAELVLVEPTGSETQILARLGADQTIVCVLRERIRAHAGDTVRLKFKDSALHLFDPATGVRIAESHDAQSPA
jgi:multiple sugar transport system ATP-binding protein